MATLAGRRRLRVSIVIAALAVCAGAATPAGAEASAPVEAAGLLPIGAVAPNFSVVGHDGRKVTLSSLKGHQVVLYFYPKDDTPGCTKEACELRDSWAALQKAGVMVFGVSTQDTNSHKAFAEKYKLPFPLLPDEKGELASQYHVPVVGGKARRITYLIDGNGKIKFVWPNVNPVGHAADVLAHVGAV
jgi:thioredoxin-dependent peroxiredoxin